MLSWLHQGWLSSQFLKTSQEQNTGWSVKSITRGQIVQVISCKRTMLQFVVESEEQRILDSNPLHALPQRVYIHQSSRPSAWLTCTRNSARLKALDIEIAAKCSPMTSILCQTTDLSNEQVICVILDCDLLPSWIFFYFLNCWRGPRVFRKVLPRSFYSVCLSLIKVVNCSVDGKLDSEGSSSFWKVLLLKIYQPVWKLPK